MKKLRQLLASVLMVCIVLNTPAWMETADAARQIQPKRMSAAFEMRAYIVDEEDSQEDLPNQEDEEKEPENHTESTSEQMPERSEESEPQASDNISEQMPENSQERDATEADDNAFEQTQEHGGESALDADLEENTAAQTEVTAETAAPEEVPACTATAETTISQEVPEGGFWGLEAQMEILEENANHKDALSDQDEESTEIGRASCRERV